MNRVTPVAVAGNATGRRMRQSDDDCESEDEKWKSSSRREDSASYKKRVVHTDDDDDDDDDDRREVADKLRLQLQIHGSHGNGYSDLTNGHASSSSDELRKDIKQSRSPARDINHHGRKFVSDVETKNSHYVSSIQENNDNFSSQLSINDSVDSPESLFSTASYATQLSTKEARTRGYLVGSLSSGRSMLGAAELQRYFPERRMRVFVGTWNMCGMRDVPANIDDFLLPDNVENVQDMYIIGSQEAVSNRTDWEVKIQETLGPYYALFHSGVHGTLHVAVFLRRDIIWFTSVVEEAIVTTRPGPSGIKTKGAIGISFKIFGTSFLLINSHFTAHDDKAAERIEDFRKISSGLDLPKRMAEKSEDVTARFDCVFWLGDLNSRIQHDSDRVKKLIEGIEETDNGLVSYEDIVQHDELKKAVNAGLTFHNFQEGRIKFRPTYKYNIGTDDYDTSKKLRTPSYTDRILFRCRKKNTVVCLLYDSAMSLTESDHKPVLSLFDVMIRPGIDTISLSGGQFNRFVWLQGCRQRAATRSAVIANGNTIFSNICTVS